MDFKKIFFNIKDFKLLKRRRLGKGAFGIVYLAENKKDNQLYAAKIIDVGDNFDGDDQIRIMRESSNLFQLDHPAIVKFIGLNFRSFEDSAILQPAIITEYIKNGSLKAILNKEKESMAIEGWSPSKKYICLLGISAAMKYLHQHNIMHRDLKPENVLMDENLYPKICDFGLSRCFPQSLSNSIKTAVTGQIGTPLYMAPELFADNNSYKAGIDVYAFSMLAYEIVTGKEPFFELGTNLGIVGLSEKVVKGNRPTLTNDIPRNMQELLKRCWSPNAEERPSFDEIFNLLSNDFSYSPEDVDEDEIRSYLEIIRIENNEEGDVKDKIVSFCTNETKNLIRNENDPGKIFKLACESGNPQIVEYLISNRLIDINSKLILKSFF